MKSRFTITLAPLLLSSKLVSTIAVATSSTVFAGSPLFSHSSEYDPVMCVGVKKGATTFTRMESWFATRWEARHKPTTPCLDAM
jgi:hypothetical protein